MYVPVGGENLFALRTSPPGNRPRLGFVFAGAGHMFSAQRNRLPVRLCRRLARSGVAALRFDYLGTGDSTGAPPALYHLDRPFVEQTIAAADALTAAGPPSFVLAGSCFGARSALAAAPRLDGTVGLALIAPPIGDAHSGEGSLVSHLGSGMRLRTYVKRGTVQVLRGIFTERRVRKYGRRAAMGMVLATRAALGRLTGRGRFQGRDRSVSAEFTASLSAAVRRGVPILIVYGERDPHLAHFRHASQSGALAAALAEGGDLIDVRVLPGEIEGFATVEAQESVLRLIHEWVTRLGRALDAAGPGTTTS